MRIIPSFAAFFFAFSYSKYNNQYFVVHTTSLHALSALKNNIHARYQENALEYPKSSWISWQQLQRCTQQFIADEQHRLSKKHWLQQYNPFTRHLAFTPFVQKYILPVGSKVAFFGDLHGNIHGLIRILQYLKEQRFIDDNLCIIDPTFHIVFLGDYTDRGNFGAEVIYTLLQLKHNNPNNVFLVRGNHEDADLNAYYGFSQELSKKFGVAKNELDCIYRIYDYMPAALYLGIKNQHATELKFGHK